MMKRKGHVDVETATKRARAAEERLAEEIAAEESDPRASETLLAQFTTVDGVESGPRLALPRGITQEQLHTLLNAHILKNVRSRAACLPRPPRPRPHSFSPP